jgi:hypothetical protein
LLDVPDHAQYFSWMRELGQSHLAANKLTPEANTPAFFNLLWWLFGRFGRLTGWGFAPVYQLLRVGAAVAFLWAAYRICSWYFPDRPRRRLAFLVISFTSGFGWCWSCSVRDGWGLDRWIYTPREYSSGIMGCPFLPPPCTCWPDLLLQGKPSPASCRGRVAGPVLGWQRIRSVRSIRLAATRPAQFATGACRATSS